MRYFCCPSFPSFLAKNVITKTQNKSLMRIPKISTHKKKIRVIEFDSSSMHPCSSFCLSLFLNSRFYFYVFFYQLISAKKCFVFFNFLVWIQLNCEIFYSISCAFNPSSSEYLLICTHKKTLLMTSTWQIHATWFFTHTNRTPNLLLNSGDMSVEDVPQIVLLTFDDSVNDLNKQLYSDLFGKGRVNPNGCPISATFYVSHEWTDYSQVQNLYADGHEMASHTVS